MLNIIKNIFGLGKNYDIKRNIDYMQGEEINVEAYINGNFTNIHLETTNTFNVIKSNLTRFENDKFKLDKKIKGDMIGVIDFKVGQVNIYGNGTAHYIIYTSEDIFDCVWEYI